MACGERRLGSDRLENKVRKYIERIDLLPRRAREGRPASPGPAALAAKPYVRACRRRIGGEPIEHSEPQKSGVSAVGTCASLSEKKCPSYSCCTFSAQTRSSHSVFASRPYVIVADQGMVKTPSSSTQYHQHGKVPVHIHPNLPFVVGHAILSEMAIPRGPFFSGFAKVCNSSMKSLAIAFGVRFFRVKISVGGAFMDNRNGQIWTRSYLAPKCSVEPGRKVRNRPISTRRV